jgi:hypothetical protein
MRTSADEINAQAASGPPEGVPAKAFLMLIDPDGGKTLAISLFDTEDDMRAGDAVLNEMSPPDDGFGQRTAVETYEVAVDVRL